MSESDYVRLNRDLGFGFDDYVVRHLESPLLEPLTDKGEAALVAFLTDDPGFNAWSLQCAACNRSSDNVPDRPIALYYVPVPKAPSVEGVDWEKARVLGRFILKRADGAKTEVAV